MQDQVMQLAQMLQDARYPGSTSIPLSSRIASLPITRRWMGGRAGTPRIMSRLRDSAIPRQIPARAMGLAFCHSSPC